MQAHRVDPAAAGANGTALAFERDGLRVTAFVVDHAPVAPAVGYRFDYRGRSVVVSGDTKPVASLVEAARGADVLVHEAQANHVLRILAGVATEQGRERVATILHDIESYHSTPVEAARAANAAGVRLLVLTHLTPPPPNALIERIFLRDVDGVRAEGVVLARDGTLVELPLGSDAAVVRQLE
jgi:ribonuclease Z